jgi:hypothetical protein
MSLSLFALYFWLGSALIASLLIAFEAFALPALFRVFRIFRGLIRFRVFSVFRGLKFWLLCLGVLILFLRSCLRGS